MRPGRALFGLFAAVVAIQGIHVIEHVLQLVQVYVLGIPDDRALEVLGYVLLRLGPAIPGFTLPLFVVGAVALETWHVVEHVVIISNVIRNQGCPCPGIVDAATGLSDTVLHFFYNAVAYASLLPAFSAVLRLRGASIALAPATGCVGSRRRRNSSGLVLVWLRA